MNPLDQLKDVHLPDPVSWWPLALGWWIVIVISLVAIIGLISWYVMQHKRSAAKRAALRELSSISPHDTHWQAQVNELVKRVALCYFPQNQIAGLHSEQWTDFLACHLPNDKQAQFRRAFGQMQHALYQVQNNDDNVVVIEQVRYWMKTALPPSKKSIEERADV